MSTSARPADSMMLHPANGRRLPDDGIGEANGEHVDAFASRRDDLERQLAAARDRAVAARQRLAEREAEARARMRAEVASVRERIAALDVEHRDALASIDEAADLQIARLLATAAAGTDQASVAAPPMESATDDH